MPDLSDLLDTALDSDELDNALCPEGTWKGELVAIRIGDPRTDKNGEEYRMARFVVRPKEAQGDVDPDEAASYLEKEGGDAIVSMSVFLRRKRDFKRLSTMLQSLGIPVTGRTIAEIAEEYNGGIEVLAEVSHFENDDGDVYDQVDSIAPASGGSDF